MGKCFILSIGCLVIGLATGFIIERSDRPAVEGRADSDSGSGGKAVVGAQAIDSGSLPAAINVDPLQRRSKGGRNSSLKQLIRKVESGDFSELRNIYSVLQREDQTGRENGIERRIVLYRMGEVNGADAIRMFFQADADRSEIAHAIVLEGWAHQEPRDALTWWSELPPGNMRKSLLASVAQGFLSADGGTWEILAGVLRKDEFEAFALPMVRHTLEKVGIAAALTIFEEHFSDTHGSHVKQNVAGMLNEKICLSNDVMSMRRWVELSTASVAAMSDSRRKSLLIALGAASGADSFDWMLTSTRADGSPLVREHERSTVLIGWVRSQPRAAAVWLESKRKNPMADMTAFQLGMANVKENPDAVTKWAEYISDDELGGTARDIIARY